MPFGTEFKPTGSTRSSAVEEREHESQLFARRIIEIPNDMQQRFAYDGDGNVLYAGYAPRSLASSTSGWLIHKFTYESGQVTLRQSAYDSWDNRATTATYA